MLTEVDMIRIMAEKYALAESVTEEYIDYEPNDDSGNAYLFEKLGCDMSNTSDIQIRELNKISQI